MHSHRKLQTEHFKFMPKAEALNVKCAKCEHQILLNRYKQNHRVRYVRILFIYSAGRVCEMQARESAEKLLFTKLIII